MLKICSTFGSLDNLNYLKVGDIIYILYRGEYRYYMIINSPIEGQFSLMETTTTKNYKSLSVASSSISELVEKECKSYDIEGAEEFSVGWGSSQNRAEILKYAIKHGYEPVKAMTLDQIESILGHRVVLVK